VVPEERFVEAFVGGRTVGQRVMTIADTEEEGMLHICIQINYKCLATNIPVSLKTNIKRTY